MGIEYAHRCNKCRYMVYTSGPWEFYRDSEGGRKRYRRPRLSAEEARERGIYGFDADLYCSKCEKNYDLILVEYKQPTYDVGAAQKLEREPKDEFKNEKPKCPACGNTSLLLEGGWSQWITCPRCKDGVLVATWQGIS